jgi:hypothetical protein
VPPDDPDLPVTFEWAHRTNGKLSQPQRERIRAGIRRSYRDVVRGVAGWPFHHSRASGEFPRRPDSRLARVAEEAAFEQGPALRQHGYRTWLIGAALADQDGARLDAELFYITSLLHDAGMVSEVAGQDFTVRSGQILIEVCCRADVGGRGQEAADAAVAHATPGLRSGDNLAGFYVQAGAMADLAGLRMWDLPRGYIRRAYRAYPGSGAHAEIPRLIRREAREVPDGRFAMLRAAGMDRMVAVSPTRLYSRPRS